MRYLFMLVVPVMMSGWIPGFSIESRPEPLVPTTTPADKTQSIMEQLRADGRYLILVAALKDTELEKTLSGKGRYTFFAPTDDAFGRVPRLGDLLHDSEKLRTVLEHHLVVDQVVDTTVLRTLRTLQPAEGEVLDVKPGDSSIKINDAKIVAPDLLASNGILHGIDHVLMKENGSVLGEAGRTVEHGLKKGARKIKNAFSGKKSDSMETAPKP